MNTYSLTERCQAIFESKSHACFGISPFNSYFSEDRIEKLARWGKTEFKSMHFFVPDVPSAYTLEALGYTPEKAAWKARRQCQYLQNKIHRALDTAGFSDPDVREEMILNWERLSTNREYVRLYGAVRERFESDHSFQASCIDAARWVLERRVPGEQMLTQDVLASAARYLLAEIPLFLDTAAIVGKDISVFCYHQQVRFLEDLFQGTLAVRPSVRQGFIVIEPDGLVPSGPSPADFLARTPSPV